MEAFLPASVRPMHVIPVLLATLRIVVAERDRRLVGRPGGGGAAQNRGLGVEWVGQLRQYRQALPPSRAVPGVTGEVYLEWQGESFYVVAEITSAARVEWTLSLPGQPDCHWLTEGRLPFF